MRGLTPLLAMSALLAPWIWVGSRAVGDAANHVGFDPRYLAVSTVPAVAWFVRDRGRTAMSRVAVLLAGLSVAGLFWLYSSRRLVDYETWLDLGMPQPGATSANHRYYSHPEHEAPAPPSHPAAAS